MSDSEAGDEKFMSRWARRKAAIQSGETLLEPDEIAAQAAAEEALEQEQAKTLEEMSDEELLEEFDLPDPDTMEAGDDFSAFMKSAIPSRIKNRALRRLWLSNPALANLDMLVDYGDDFTDAAMVVPDMKTIYQVGKGIVRKVEEAVEKVDENTEVESDSEQQEMALEEEAGEEASELDDATNSEVAATEATDVPDEAEIAFVAAPEPVPLAAMENAQQDDGEGHFEPQTGFRHRMKFEV